VPFGFGRYGVWSNFDRLPAKEVVAFAQQAERVGYQSFWTQESAGRDPFALLAHLAARTDQIGLGVGIAIIYARDAVATRGGALTVQELSRGRMILGLGASHRDTVSEVRGQEYRAPLSAMREYLNAYQRASYRAPRVGGEPPLILAALRRRMLELAATRADGAYPYLVPVDYVPAARARLDLAAAAAGRSRPTMVVSCPVLRATDASTARTAARGYLDRYLGLPNYLRNLAEIGFTRAELEKPGADRLVDALVAWGDETKVRKRLRAYLEAGADHVCLIPLTAEGKMADRATMEAFAPPW